MNIMENEKMIWRMEKHNLNIIIIKKKRKLY